MLPSGHQTKLLLASNFDLTAPKYVGFCMAIVSGVSAVVEHTYLVIGPCTHVVTCLPEFPAVVLPLIFLGFYRGVPE